MLVLISLTGLVVSSAGIYYLTSSTIKSFQVTQWKPIIGNINSLEISRSVAGEGADYFLTMHYEYAVKDHNYKDSYFFSAYEQSLKTELIPYLNSNDMEYMESIEEFPITPTNLVSSSTPVTVYYNPRNPKESTIDNKSGRSFGEVAGNVFVISLLLIIFLGALILFIATIFTGEHKT